MRFVLDAIRADNLPSAALQLELEMHLVAPTTTVNRHSEKRCAVTAIQTVPCDLALLCIGRCGHIAKRLLVYLLAVDGGLTVQVGVGTRIVLPHEGQAIVCSDRDGLIGLLKERVQRDEDSPGNECC